MGKDVIIACDFDSAEETLSFLDSFSGQKPFEDWHGLFYAKGGDSQENKEEGSQHLLDLKLHDIPNTVKKPCLFYPGLMWTWLTCTQREQGAMMEAALEGLQEQTEAGPYLLR